MGWDQQVLDRISPEAVAEALEGFALRSTQPLGLLSKAIREALRMSMMMSRDVSWRTSSDFNRKGPRGGPDRQSNAETKKELTDLAKRASALAKKLTERSPEADQVLWLHAFWNNPNERQSQPSEHLEFLGVVAQLDWLTRYLSDAAAGIEKQPARWVDAERREQRIFHAMFLAGVFEWAYEKPATVTSWREDMEGPWPDFFQRIMALASDDEPKTPNLENVLHEARRRQKDSGVLFDPKTLAE